MSKRHLEDGEEVARRLKIVHVCTTFMYRSGGISRLFARLGGMLRAGYQVTLVVGRDYEPAPHWDMNDFDVHQIKSLVKYISPVKDIQTFFLLAKAFRKIRPDVIHTHFAKAGLLGRLAAYFSRTPLILHTVHGPTFAKTLPVHKRIGYRWLETVVGRITNYFVFVGEEIRNEYIHAGVCDNYNSVVIYTGRPDEELDRIKELGTTDKQGCRQSFFKTKKAFIVVCVGRVVPSKQQEHAILVIQQLRQMGINAKLIIVGEAFIKEEKRYVGFLKKLVDQLYLQDHISFSGYRTDVLDIMASADAILHTSKYEGLPNVLVEAGLAARPVVCYAVCGAREVIHEERTGYIVEQGDVSKAAERLFYLATNSPEADKMGLAAHDIISNNFRESTMVKRKLGLYKELFERQRLDSVGKRGPYSTSMHRK
jgi:glycosyltransferase involved in cell wall biosynthesis